MLFTFFYHCGYTQDSTGTGIQQNAKFKTEFEEIKSMVDSSQFVFQANIIFPVGYEPIHLTVINNYLVISGNKVGANLPYFGRADNISYADISANEDEGGIVFSGQMKDYKVEPGEKKNKVTVSFSVNYKDDAFNCILYIFTGGKASLNITSQKRESISYQGYTYPLKRRVSTK